MADHDRLVRGIQRDDTVATSLSWSPDGERLAVGDFGVTGAIEVLTREGQSLWQRTRQESVADVAWSPDGQRLTSGSERGELVVWDAATGTVVTRQTGLSVSRVSWAPDSGRIAAIASGALVIVDASSGGRRGHPRDALTSVSWAPDGRRLAIGTLAGGLILADEAAPAQAVEVDRNPRWNQIEDVNWSPDGQWVASGSSDGSLRVWDATVPKPVSTCSGHSGKVVSATWSPDGQWLLSASTDQTVRVWDPRTGSQRLRIDTRAVMVRAAWSPDGTLVASIGGDRTLRLWNVADLGSLGRVSGPLANSYVSRQLITIGRQVPGVAGGSSWAPQLPNAAGRCLGIIDAQPRRLCVHDKRLVTGEHGFVRCWNLQTGSALWERRGEKVDSSAVACQPARQMLAVLWETGLLELGDFTGSVDRRIRAHASDASGACWSADGARLATSGLKDGVVRVWDASTLERLGEYRAEAGFLCVDWSEDAGLIAAGALDGTIYIIDPDSSRLVRRMAGDDGQVSRVKWLPDAQRLLAASLNGIQLYSQTSDGPVALDDTFGGCYDIALSPNGRFVAVGGIETEAIWVWDVAREQRVAEFDRPVGMYYLTWAPDGAYLVAGGGKTYIWDTRDLMRSSQTASGSGPADPVPPGLMVLPTAAAQLQRAGVYAPLSVLADLVALTGGRPVDSPLATLATHPQMHELVGLRWPTAARVGLAALVIHRLPFEDWRPPEEWIPAQTRDTLTSALEASRVVPAEPAGVSAPVLMQALDAIDARVLTVLEMLGPEAVAQDPGVLLRLIARLGDVPALPRGHRRLLGVQVPLQEQGASQGSSGGSARGGIELKGSWPALLASQWALSPAVRAYKYHRSELLYRGRMGAEPPRLRPVVLVLDVSPATHGAVEQVTRLAAFLVTRCVRAAGARLVLVASGGQEQIRELESPASWVDVWTLRTVEAADPGRSLRVARALQAETGTDAVVLVLSHAWYGSEAGDLPTVSGLRGLFVQYPGHHVRPPLAARCERWESVDVQRLGSMATSVGRLIG